MFGFVKFLTVSARLHVCSRTRPCHFLFLQKPHFVPKRTIWWFRATLQLSKTTKSEKHFLCKFPLEHYTICQECRKSLAPTSGQTKGCVLLHNDNIDLSCTSSRHQHWADDFKLRRDLLTDQFMTSRALSSLLQVPQFDQSQRNTRSWTQILSWDSASSVSWHSGLMELAEGKKKKNALP